MVFAEVAEKVTVEIWPLGRRTKEAGIPAWLKRVVIIIVIIWGTQLQVATRSTESAWVRTT